MLAGKGYRAAFCLLMWCTTILARMWNVNVCFPSRRRVFQLTINGDRTTEITNRKSQYCSYTRYNIKDSEIPSTVLIENVTSYEVILKNFQHQKVYVYTCYYNCTMKHTLLKASYWFLTAKLKSFNTTAMRFKTRANISKVIWSPQNSLMIRIPFFLPTYYDKKQSVVLDIIGNAWYKMSELKLKNVQTAKIYKCLEFRAAESGGGVDMPCRVEEASAISGRDSAEKTSWKIELTFPKEETVNRRQMAIISSWNNGLRNISYELMLVRRGVPPIFYADVFSQDFPLENIQVAFTNTSKQINISKIVVRNNQSDHGCTDVQYSDQMTKYSCELKKSKNLLLTVISQNLSREKMFLEIFQGSVYSATSVFVMKNHRLNRDLFLIYTNLKTYEDTRITRLIFHNAPIFQRNFKLSVWQQNSEYSFMKDHSCHCYVLQQQQHSNDSISFRDSLDKTSIISVGVLSGVIVMLLIVMIYLTRCQKDRNADRKFQNLSNMDDSPEKTSSNSRRNATDSVPEIPVSCQRQDTTKKSSTRNPPYISTVPPSVPFEPRPPDTDESSYSDIGNTGYDNIYLEIIQ
ncbi:uncharacterized protein LOC115217841 isoform X1 [Argonauta hians]